LNDSLRAFGVLFKLDGDLLRCRLCNRGIVASRADEDMAHEFGCDARNQLRPWARLRAILSQNRCAEEITENRKLRQDLQYAENAFRSDQRLMFAALKILRDNGIEVGSKELCEAARRIMELERKADAFEWQPIESCPKDGSAFMAFQPHEQEGFVFPAALTKAGRIVDTLDGNAFPRATHWRPLPAFPENAEPIHGGNDTN